MKYFIKTFDCHPEKSPAATNGARMNEDYEKILYQDIWMSDE